MFLKESSSISRSLMPFDLDHRICCCQKRKTRTAALLIMKRLVQRRQKHDKYLTHSFRRIKFLHCKYVKYFLRLSWEAIVT